MSIYESHKKVSGANKSERAILKTLKGVDFLAFINKRKQADRKQRKEGEDYTSKYLYMKFIAGAEVPEFVRTQIMQFVREKSQELRSMGRDQD